MKARKVLILPYLHERRIYLNRRHKANQFYTLVMDRNYNNYILCLCIPDNKMYVYTETGILVDRVSYKDIAEQYGKPIEISENGLILIFKKGHDSPIIHLVMVHIDKLEWVRSIDVKQQLEEYMNSDLSLSKYTAKQRDELQQFYKLYLNKLENMKKIDMTFCLNDDAEILVRLKPKKATDRERLAKELIKSAATGVIKDQKGVAAAVEFEEKQVS